ncbi:MAG: DUF1533 domain-containing protein [Verrucomicrobiae bacterium]|nr:DUF1533 domain-containing protein [Verrucomicrobiae bacterium]
MKIKNMACTAALLLASLSAAKAAITLTAWNFDNLAIGANSSPAPSTGFGTASALGMGNSYNASPSTSNPDIQVLAGSSGGSPNCWQITGIQTGGNGWSTNAPIGSQGAQFAGSTVGYYKIKVSFDVNATAAAEANLQVQYTTDGHFWFNATNIILGGAGTLVQNSLSTNSIIGTYIVLASGWNNSITVDLSGISGVDNNSKFAVRMVNASTSTDCTNAAGVAFDETTTTGNWSFDNTVITGVSIDTITEWTFESESLTKSTVVSNPVAEFGTGLAKPIGFSNTYPLADGNTFSVSAADVTQQGGSSVSSSVNCWRVRGNGGNGGNGWSYNAPIGTQGAEFDVSTVNYNDVVFSFDLYFTTQAEAKMFVEYTTDGWTHTNIANNLFYAANPTFIQTNTDVTDVNTVMGTYFFETTGQNFYNNLVVDFTGVPGVANNPNFGIRVVNAATGTADCVNYTGGTYNNASGNCRFDNVTFGGTYTGSLAPVLTYDAGATVDRTFTNTFTDDATWRSKIGAIYVNGALLPKAAYSTAAGKLIFNPANSTNILGVSGVDSIVIYATNYSNAKVTQPVAAGVAVKLALITQASGPSASGGTLIANPVLAVVDKYGNSTTNPYANVSVSAAAAGASGWTLGGSTNQASVKGVISFSNLTATVNGSTAVSGAAIAFYVTGYTNTTSHSSATNFNSATFSIGAPSVLFTPGNLAILQLDTANLNTTFSIIEVNPNVAGQTKPANIIPISATGTNALRESNSGSCGKLSLSSDGTLITFAAFADDDAATPDETFNLHRGVGTLNFTNLFTEPATYVSTSLGGSQARSCTTVDNINYIIDDKAFLYLAGPGITPSAFDLLNNVVVRAFGQKVYVETQKTTALSPIPTLYGVDVSDPGNPTYDVSVGNGLGTDPVANDFYLISTNGGSTYDVLYVLDGQSSSLGVINKFLYENGSWVYGSSITNNNGGDSLFATTNNSGGVNLFYTTGPGTGNSVVRLTDAVAWSTNLTITASNVIYTASASTIVKGLTFTPLTNGATQLLPSPTLIPQTGALLGSPATVALSPEDAIWRTAITNVTVNGTPLAPGAYSTAAGQLILAAPSVSAGLNTIVVQAAGYSPNSTIQPVGFGPVLVGGTQLIGGKLKFNFTNATGLSYSILSTNIVTAPVPTWPVVGTPVEGPAGIYGFTNATPATNAVQFYLLRQNN